MDRAELAYRVEQADLDAFLASILGTPHPSYTWLVATSTQVQPDPREGSRKQIILVEYTRAG